MKVLLGGQTYYRRDNGQAVFTINLAEGLVAAGHDVLVLAPADTRQPSRRIVRGVEVQSVPAVALVDNTNITAFSGHLTRQVIEEMQPDVVHIQDHYFLSRALLAAALASDVVCVGTNHFLPDNLADNILRKRSYTRWVQEPLDRVLWKTMLSVYNQLAAVTTPTETAAALLRAQGIHVPVSAISCGVDVNRFNRRPTVDRTRLRSKYGLGQDKVLLLYVGRIDREKGLDLLITALSKTKLPDVQLVIAGKGAYRADLERRTLELGLADKVVFTGFVPDEDLPLLLNSVDVFVMPSHAELQSIATLEAMASGLPILAANARALPELVTPGVNGYLFDPRNSADAAKIIARCIGERAQWDAMGNASRTIAEAHAYEIVIAAYIRWYQARVA